MDLDECRKKGFVKPAFPNKAKATSLLEVSRIKDKTLKSVVFDKDNINAYFPMAYDSLREVLEAICLLSGYDVTNHICLGELMQELVDGFDYVSFDRFRYARNGINYYGRKIDLEQGKILLKKVLAMRSSMEKKAKEMHNT